MRQLGDVVRSFLQQAHRLLSEGGVILHGVRSFIGGFYRSVHGTRFLVQVGFRVRLFGTSSPQRCPRMGAWRVAAIPGDARESAATDG